MKQKNETTNKPDQGDREKRGRKMTSNKLQRQSKLATGMVALATLLTASLVNAQSSSVSSVPAASAGSTSSTSASSAQPAKKKFGVNFVSQGAIQSKDIEAYGVDGAAYTSENAIGLSYKLTDKVSIEANHNFAYTTQRENISRDIFGYSKDAYIQRNPMFAVGYKTDQKIADSDPIALKAKMYIGNDRLNKSINRVGVLRLDATTSWTANTLLSVDLIVSPRLGFYNSSSANQGQTQFRLVTGPQFNLNHSDRFSTYYAPTADLRTFDSINQGVMHFEALNALTHEVGMNLTLGPVTINPAYATTVDLNNGSGFQSIDRTEYDLNIIATF